LDGDDSLSCKVLIVPEDPTYNGHILKPLIQRMLEQCGKPNAKESVLSEPRLQGDNHAKEKLPEIQDRYQQHLDLILFLVDADGKDRAGEFARLEGATTKLICAAAVQEVEIWLLAGHADKLGQPWQEVRQNISVKEQIFALFLATHGEPRRYGEGRDILMKQALENYQGILQRCPELKILQERIGSTLS
jgi:hypothetical protein